VILNVIIWNFQWSTESSIDPWQNVPENCNLCAIQFRLVVQEVDAQQSSPCEYFFEKMVHGQKWFRTTVSEHQLSAVRSSYHMWWTFWATVQIANRGSKNDKTTNKNIDNFFHQGNMFKIVLKFLEYACRTQAAQEC